MPNNINVKCHSEWNYPIYIPNPGYSLKMCQKNKSKGHTLKQHKNNNLETNGMKTDPLLPMMRSILYFALSTQSTRMIQGIGQNQLFISNSEIVTEDTNDLSEAQPSCTT